MGLPFGLIDGEMRIAAVPASDTRASQGSGIPDYEPPPCIRCPQQQSCQAECGRFKHYVAHGTDPGGATVFRGGRPLAPGALQRRRQAGIPAELVEAPVRVIAERLGLPRNRVQRAVDLGRPLELG